VKLAISVKITSVDLGIVHGTAHKIGDAVKNKELMAKAYDLGLKAK